MGATASAQHEAKSTADHAVVEEEEQEEQRASDRTESREEEEEESADPKQLQKNGQISISSLNGKADEQTELNGEEQVEGAVENTPDPLGQTDAMPQKDESPEMIEELQNEGCPQVNGEREENESITAEKITAAEDKGEEKPTESNEVGFKKMFRFVGFKFTLKKDKNEKAEPVQLLTVKDTENGAVESAEETKESAETEEAKPENQNTEDSEETEKKPAGQDTVEPEVADIKTEEPVETTADGAEEPQETSAEQPTEEIITSTEKESETSPPAQETQSPFKRFFTQGIFSNLRKKTSFKKNKDEETVKEKSAEEEIKEDEEKTEEAVTDGEQVKEEVETKEQVEKSEESEKAEASPEEAPTVTEEPKVEELSVEVNGEKEIEVEQESAPETQTTTCDVSTTPDADVKDEIKPSEEKLAESTEEKTEKSTAESSADTELSSSQEKAKTPLGSPLKKLFTGAGLKKLSAKKQKGKKDTESKLTDSGEQPGEQIQSSTESAEVPKTESGASSPEESGEHVLAAEAEGKVDNEGEAATSDSEKKKDGIQPWASFKKLVTPKKRVKRPSESEDEAAVDKPKSATLSSTESAVFEEKTEENKPSDEVQEEVKEESQSECKTETKAEKVEQVTEEPKKKMDTSVSWEALICVGSAKKRARKTSDSDGEEAKIEEELQQSGEEQSKTVESPLGTSQEADQENAASSPEPEGELVSTWESFKRLVTQRKKPKAEDKSDEGSAPEQTISDSEIPKEESSFSLRKLIPRRKKKSEAKQGQTSSDVGSTEEDSDTPAVVPLSEYDTDKSEAIEVAETQEPKPDDLTPVTPAKGSAEDRSPSWISTTVEQAEDEAEGKQLSDIPEEADMAATPKSADNTIAEDIVEITSEAITALEPAEETEMVSALSRVTASPVTSGETTPVPGEAVITASQAVLQEAVENITVTSSCMAVTVTEEQATSIAVSSSPFQVESCINEENVVLVVHEKTEATAICTGLNIDEMQGIEESPLTASVEAVATITEALPLELAPGDQTLEQEEAKVAEEQVFVAEVNNVPTYIKELEVEEKQVEETQVAMTDANDKTVNDFQEATAAKVAVVTAVQQDTETLDELVTAENSPKMEAESTIEPTIEESVCVQTVSVTEMAVAAGEQVQELKNAEESVACGELSSVEEAVAITQEIATSLASEPETEIVVCQEVPILLNAPTEEPKITEELIIEVAKTEETDEKANVEKEAEVAEVEEITSAVTEEVNENVEMKDQMSETIHVQEAEAIQEQSTVIVQEVIQSVVENLGEMLEKPLEEMESSTTEPEEAPVPEIVSAVCETTESEPVTPVKEENHSAVEVTAVTDAPVAEDTTEESHENPPVSVEPVPSEPESKPDEEPTQIITEKSQKLVNEALQVSEPVLITVNEEIQDQQEVASVCVEVKHESTAAVKQEVALNENIVDAEDKENDTEGQVVQEDGDEVVILNQEATPEAPAEEPPPEEEQSLAQTATLVSTTQTQVLELASQQVESIQIEKTTEISVGIVHVKDADEGAKEEPESQEASDDTTQKEQTQQDVSAEETEGAEKSEDGAETKAMEVQMATEVTTSEIKEEKVENEIKPVPTEMATLS